MQVGTTKDQGLYNKPSAAVHPGALAAGTLPQYNTIIRRLSESYTPYMDITSLLASDSAVCQKNLYEVFLKAEKLPAIYVMCVTMMPLDFFAVMWVICETRSLWPTPLERTIRQTG